MCNAVDAVDPCCTHRTRSRLLFSKHEVIDNERPIRRGKQFTQSYYLHRIISGGERSRALEKLVILNCCSRWQRAAKFRNAFTLSHQLNFRVTQLFTFCQVLWWFVGQVSLSIGAVD